ncbi:alpha/beta hydrolase [Candidatus Uabimicrobium amorphum]|nr:alpha/beta hydrolase [Candidatus Uabimicrobium amorphum]
MHGLESGLQGKKSHYLHSHFANTYTPDMQMSLLNVRKKHSVLRNICKTKLFRVWFVLLLLCVTISCFMSTTHTIVSFVIGILVFLAVKKHLIQRALDISLQQCVTVQSNALQEFQPHIVVGSSWGGLVALICLSQNAHSCPVILIAPPVKMILNKIDPSEKKWLNMCEMAKQHSDQIYIVHGEKDQTVPLEDSQEFIEKAGGILQVIPGGDHSLNDSLLEDDTPYALKNIITNLR